jgi:hypothetical protein
MNRRIPERNLAVEPNVAAQRILQNDLLDRRRVLMQQNQSNRWFGQLYH